MRFLVTAVVSLAFFAAAARADIGPKPREYAPGLEARGDLEGLNVEMTSEDVTVTLAATGKKRHERPMAKDLLGAKFWVCKRLREAASRQGPATMTEAELKNACAAFGSCLEGASEKDGVWTVPIQPAGECPTTAYDWGEFLLETFPGVVGLAETNPKSEEALATLGTWEPIAEAFAAGRLQTLWEKRKASEPAKVQAPVKRDHGAWFDAARTRAKGILGTR